jgi:hypothetical protein
VDGAIFDYELVPDPFMTTSTQQPSDDAMKPGEKDSRWN